MLQKYGSNILVINKMTALKDLSLVARATIFTELLGRCKFTAMDQTIFQLEEGVGYLFNKLISLRRESRNLYLIGNGGSAGVASHSTTDFFNVAKIRAITLHESSLMTCMANDFGYENAYALMLRQMLKPGDMLIAISSSGKSMNIRNAVSVAKDSGAFVVTFSGFAHDNPLRMLGDLNVWLDSNDYGFVEIGHQFILHNLADRFACI